MTLKAFHAPVRGGIQDMKVIPVVIRYVVAVIALILCHKGCAALPLERDTDPDGCPDGCLVIHNGG